MKLPDADYCMLPAILQSYCTSRSKATGFRGCRGFTECLVGQDNILSYMPIQLIFLGCFAI